MIKSIGFMLLSLWSVTCLAKDALYYSVHPKALQQAIAQCPNRAPGTVSCSELKTIALRVNALAYELRMDPQAYGHKVLALQETIANQTTSHAAVVTNQTELNERLAIIKWLESPES